MRRKARGLSGGGRAPAERAPGSTDRGPAVVTHTLTGLCCLFFVLGPVSGLNPAHGGGDRLIAAQNDHFRRWGLVPADLFGGSPEALLTPLTAFFVHGGWLHLLGNLLFLHVFGRMVETRLGPARYVLLLAGTGYLALTAFAAADPVSDQPLVGASGAVSGVLGAFLLLFPRARVTSLFPFLFFLPLRFPAWVVLPFWFALQWLASQSAPEGSGVAYLAHLTGFLAGFLWAWVRYGGAARVSSADRATEGDSQP
ncbi:MULTISPECIES: rhomboid family intramembrane serine protease [Streptomyces]|uniref:Rhomboid family intramembrane serine protease n=1 Tax=Streptomyces xinghaiensis TaxID=1038928 RepID=A0A420V9W9_9ACTN|nr:MULTISPECIES: rhomboid family intramembrane serine protease [Streptomyces]PQM25085.1 rhomboid family intramembrane serine protease [Streptomyces xinghaiensis]RKM99135.1 rhomboid family intramembrane serine protease [Streptomyces xinghaiensis]RNC75961.1 rhomboid family intramembrane serine protease [Streptomyces xinghaiensis]